MTCRACGATIADKAIVCYRCGAPTADPASLAPRRAVPPPRRPIWVFPLSVLLLLFAVIAWLVPLTQNPAVDRWLVWIPLALAFVLPVTALLARRR